MTAPRSQSAHGRRRLPSFRQCGRQRIGCTGARTGSVTASPRGGKPGRPTPQARHCLGSPMRGSCTGRSKRLPSCHVRTALLGCFPPAVGPVAALANRFVAGCRPPDVASGPSGGALTLDQAQAGPQEVTPAHRIPPDRPFSCFLGELGRTDGEARGGGKRDCRQSTGRSCSRQIPAARLLAWPGVPHGRGRSTEP